MSDALLEAGGGLRVQGEEELFDALKLLLSDPETRKKMGTAAKAYVERNRGALDRVIGHVGECLGTEDEGSRKNGG
jgi:3-deoxy-D-manno-octulosonic-acid transferase